MDRVFTYDGEIPLATDILSTNRNILIALGLLAQDVFGVATVVGGLTCSPSTPPALTVSVGAGRMYSLQNVDNSAYSDLPIDTVHQVIKQGINLNATTLSCPAPLTNGFSINYLIEAEYQDSDTGLTVLQYFNASNPNSPFSGPGNSGTSQPTVRAGQVNLVAKAGIPAPTGTQLTPSPDVGFIGLYVVTVAFGQSTILSGNIAQLPGAPFLAGGLLSQASADARYLQLTGGTLSGTLIGPNAVLTSCTVNGISVQNASLFTSGLLAAAVVPQSAVTQWQSALAIGWTQITGTKNADQLNDLVAGPEGGFAPETLARYNASGYLFAQYFNQSSANSENPVISQIIVTNGADGFFRKCSVANFESQLNVGSLGGAIAASQVPLVAVSQWAPSIKCRNFPSLGSTNVTIAADPGVVPSGQPGDVFEYY